MNRILLLAMLATSMSADTIDFGTAVHGTIGSNSATGLDVITAVSSAWHSPLGSSQWESIQSNPLVPPIPDGEVDFTFIFYVEGWPLSGELGVLVDDSALGALNGHQLFDNRGSPLSGHCAQSLPTCTAPLEMNITQYLRPGLNYLDVTVEQDVPNTYFGLDVYGTVTACSTVPEPTTILLLGSGLLLIGGWRKSK